MDALTHETQSYSGAILAAAFADVLWEYGILEKMLSLTVDNAATNDTMTTNLAKLIPSFGGEAMQT
jgi:hypothetical protein